MGSNVSGGSSSPLSLISEALRSRLGLSGPASTPFIPVLQERGVRRVLTAAEPRVTTSTIVTTTRCDMFQIKVYYHLYIYHLTFQLRVSGDHLRDPGPLHLFPGEGQHNLCVGHSDRGECCIVSIILSLLISDEHHHRHREQRGDHHPQPAPEPPPAAQHTQLQPREAWSGS